MQIQELPTSRQDKHLDCREETYRPALATGWVVLEGPSDRVGGWEPVSKPSVGGDHRGKDTKMGEGTPTPEEGGDKDASL